MIKKLKRIKTNLNIKNVFIKTMSSKKSKDKEDEEFDFLRSEKKMSNRSSWPKIAGIFLILTSVGPS